ncbi:YbbR-like domain-containing protein [uncultured Tenacibaculum sp.]|uniref:CdaR family protein n=1 Tax=uncultured Tenacibaculum sp. TaxID=174713 RepID=UPI002625BF76|nr:YbbR-like domain-containing protein [uncultured Tenacibaculum sp.]
MAKTLKIPKIFFGFLAASFLMWMLINLSKSYTTKVNYFVEYLDLPQDKILQEQPKETVTLIVKGSGFKLLGTSFSSKKIPFSLKKLVKKNETDYYLLTNSQKEEIQDGLNSGISLVKIDGDSIHFKLGILATKKVPIQLDVNLNYKLGYGTEKIELDKDSILISGPKQNLESISFLKTKRVVLEELSEDAEIDVEIELPKNVTELKLSDTKVKANIFVDKFTEGSFEIPIEIVGVPNDLKFSTFPKKVKVIYKVGLKNYQKITADLFKVVCDYRKTQKDNLEYLIPEIKKKPELISSIRITPQRVDFLMHK